MTLMRTHNQTYRKPAQPAKGLFAYALANRFEITDTEGYGG